MIIQKVLLSLIANGIVGRVKGFEKQGDTMMTLKRALDNYVPAAIGFMRAPIGAPYVTSLCLAIQDGQDLYNIIPNTLDLDTALNGYQCATPPCKASCQGPGLSPASNFTTNGTLFKLDQAYEILEGVRSRDTFVTFTDPVTPSPFILTNVTFMDSFYVYSKEPIVADNSTGFCSVGNGTFGLGRGMQGAMGQTIMSRYMEVGADAVGFLSFGSGSSDINGVFGIFTDLEFTSSNPREYPVLIPEWPLWTLQITNLYFNGLALGANGIGVIDGASTFLRIPKVYASLLAAFLLAIPQETPIGTQYTIPNCNPNLLPNITIAISGDLYNVTGGDYAKPSVGTNCLALFMGTDSVYYGTPIWRLGYPLFNTVSATFLNFTANNTILVPPS